MNKCSTYIKLIFSVDASIDCGLARYLNDSKHRDANCVMKLVVIDDSPSLCLFAVKDVEVGTELRYDYGCPDAVWRQKVNKRSYNYISVAMCVKYVFILYKCVFVCCSNN